MWPEQITTTYPFFLTWNNVTFVLVVFHIHPPVAPSILIVALASLSIILVVEKSSISRIKNQLQSQILIDPNNQIQRIFAARFDSSAACTTISYPLVNVVGANYDFFTD